MAGKRKVKKEVKIAIYIMVALVITAVIVLMLSQIHQFNYEESLPEIVVTIDDTNISLKELSYYIMKVEASGQESALIYNKDNPLTYWNLYMNNESETGYMTDLAKRAAINFCIRDNIYYQEAVKAGYKLTAEEESDLKYDAESAYNLMTNRQRKGTQLYAQDFEIIMLKENLSHKYMADLATSDESGVLESIMLKYDVGGTYYEQLKETYEITQNDKILDNVKVGFITIN